MKISPRMRPAGQADVPQLVQLVGQYWEFEQIEGFDAHGMAPLLERVLFQPNLGRIRVAEVDRHLVGYLIAVSPTRAIPVAEARQDRRVCDSQHCQQ